MLNTVKLSDFDPELYQSIVEEAGRQEHHIELIASENYVSRRVLEAQGSVLTNKYAEGYAHKRYYGGCQYVDIAEDLAVARAKELFGAAYANVQPHSGSQANAAVYMALLKPGDLILGMSLDQGGHLTHGSKVNFSGKLYHSIAFCLDEKCAIDYDQAEKLAQEHRPKMIMTGFSAYSGIVDWQRFREIADSIGAYLVADIAHVSGLVAMGLYPSPMNIADVCTTTTHKTLRGPRGGMILARDNAEIHKKLQSAVFPGQQGGPLMHVIAAKAVAFLEALQPDFKAYQQAILENAQALAKTLMARSYQLVSGGTHNHLMLLDLTDKDITGKDSENILGQANITVNKNSVPNDTRSPFVTSGLRFGTPAMTTRGFGVKESEQVGHWIADILDDLDNADTIARVKQSVIELCAQFPVYEA